MQYNANRERQVSETRMRGSEDPANNSELEAARPQTAGEEELQLQLALAMSREEAEQEETKTKSDDMRLQLALQKSKEETSETDNGLGGVPMASAASAGGHSSHLSKPNSNAKPSSDLLDLDFGNPVAQPPPPTRTAASSSSPHMDPWGMPASQAATQQQTQPQMDPWGGASASSAAASAAPAGPSANDPWSPVKEPPRTSPLPNAGAPSALNPPSKA